MRVGGVDEPLAIRFLSHDPFEMVYSFALFMLTCAQHGRRATIQTLNARTLVRASSYPKNRLGSSRRWRLLSKLATI